MMFMSRHVLVKLRQLVSKIYTIDSALKILLPIVAYNYLRSVRCIVLDDMVTLMHYCLRPEACSALG